MEITPITFEQHHYRQTPMPCFIKDCEKPAVHLTRFTYGVAKVSVCLCEDCVHKSPEAVLKGLGMDWENIDNGLFK
jgi:hypothetical protein